MSATPSLPTMIYGLGLGPVALGARLRARREGRRTAPVGLAG
ncbi:hypothetical protein [Cryptosporangium arvum]|nr:hypothetical protein [Cryptosporangium arvum]